jgi:hypothetical protein
MSLQLKKTVLTVKTVSSLISCDKDRLINEQKLFSFRAFPYNTNIINYLFYITSETQLVWLRMVSENYLSNMQ